MQGIGKGDKERRVPLSPTARPGRPAALAEGAEDAQQPSVGLGLVAAVGQAMRAPSMLAMMDAAACAGMDVTKISPHKLRHACATVLVEGGCRLDEVRDLLLKSRWPPRRSTRIPLRSAFRTRRRVYRM